MNDYIKREDAQKITAEWLSGYITEQKEKLTADVVEVVRCKDCIYYDPPHVEDHGKRLEYKDLPKEAFDGLGTGFVSLEYGINVGGRCSRDYNTAYSEDKRVFVSGLNYCGRAVRGDKDE